MADEISIRLRQLNVKRKNKAKNTVDNYIIESIKKNLIANINSMNGNYFLNKPYYKILKNNGLLYYTTKETTLLLNTV